MEHEPNYPKVEEKEDTLKISSFCLESYPCQHDVKENDKEIECWGAEEIAQWFITRKRHVPSHFHDVLPEGYVDLPGPAPTGLKVSPTCDNINECKHTICLIHNEASDGEWWDGEERKRETWSGQQIAAWLKEHGQPVHQHFKNC